MALSQRVITTTEEKYVPTVINGILNSNVWTSRLFQRASKTWTGRQVLVPFQYAKPTSGGQFNGVGEFDTAMQNTRVLMKFSHAQAYQNVSISGPEESLNKTDGEVLDLVKTEMEEAQDAMTDNLGDQMYGIGLGDDFLGLGGIVDDGTNTSTYGELSRTTYTMLNSTLTACAAGKLSFTYMATEMRAVSAASSKRQRPSILVTTETVWDLLESLFTPTISSSYDAISRVQISTYSKPGVTYANQDSLKGQYGFEALCWRGIPVVADEKCDSGAMFFLNEEYINWYSLKGVDLTSYKASQNIHDGVTSEYARFLPIQWSGFDKPYNQYAKLGQFIMLGNAICTSTRRQGKLTGITTV